MQADERADDGGGAGDRVVGSLEGRGLIHHVDVGRGRRAGPSVFADRIAGVVLGLAAGNAVGQRGTAGGSSAETQTFVTSCEAWLDHGWRAPEALAELFARRLPGFRSPGRALRTAVERRRRGAAWHEAASALVRQRRPVPGGRGRHRARRRRSVDRRGGLDRRRGHPRLAPGDGIVGGARRDRSPRSCGAMRRPAPADVVARSSASVGHDKVRAQPRSSPSPRGCPR